VLEARNQIESGARVAIKQIKANFKSWDECKSLRELKALKNLRHQHIVRLREMILEKVR
jgi:serine/threonine protein kinase